MKSKILLKWLAGFVVIVGLVGFVFNRLEVGDKVTWCLYSATIDAADAKTGAKIKVENIKWNVSSISQKIKGGEAAVVEHLPDGAIAFNAIGGFLPSGLTVEIVQNGYEVASIKIDGIRGGTSWRSEKDRVRVDLIPVGD